jgi:hypothetical protein
VRACVDYSTTSKSRLPTLNYTVREFYGPILGVLRSSRGRFVGLGPKKRTNLPNQKSEISVAEISIVSTFSLLRPLFAPLWVSDGEFQKFLADCNRPISSQSSPRFGVSRSRKKTCGECLAVLCFRDTFSFLPTIIS